MLHLMKYSMLIFINLSVNNPEFSYTVNSLFKILGATGKLCLESVVTLNFSFCLQRKFNLLCNVWTRHGTWFLLRDPPSNNTSASRMKTTLGYVEYLTHKHYWIALPHRFYQIVSHRNPLVKYVAHFFTKSRSIFTADNSRFTPDSSSSTSVSAL